MFEQALFEYIEANFTVSGYTLGFGFGNVLEDTKNPYIAQFVLDSDGTRQTVCDDNSYTKGGESFVQWNVYSQSSTNAFKIKRELDKFIAEIRSLTFGGDDYKIFINNKGSSPVGQFSNGLNLEILTKTFNYEVI